MVELFSKEDAQKLIDYYLPLLAGKIIEESTKAIIITIEAESEDNSQFTVKAIARGLNYSTYKRSISKVAALHNLSAPNQVLQDQGL